MSRRAWAAFAAMSLLWDVSYLLIERAVAMAAGLRGGRDLDPLPADRRRAELVGAPAILAGAVGYSIGPMLLKHRLGGLDPRALMGASLTLAAVVLTPFATFDAPRRMPSTGALAAVAALGVFCTAAAFAISAVLIREAGTSRATVPGAGAVIGLALILAGSWLSTRRTHPGAGAVGAWPTAPAQEAVKSRTERLRSPRVVQTGC